MIGINTLRKFSHCIYSQVTIIIFDNCEFRFSSRKGSLRKFPMNPRLRVGRREEPILGYISKIDRKRNLQGKGLIKILVIDNNNQCMRSV